MSERYVITGGPSVGKSTITRELSLRGYNTMPEAARVYFQRKDAEGYDAIEAREKFDFQTAIEKLRVQIRKNIRKTEGTLFADRSAIDNIAYRKHFGNEEEIYEGIESLEVGDFYDGIFILEPVGFEKDDVRNEDEDEALEIHKTIVSEYESFGYDVNLVPPVSVEKRVEFILGIVEYGSSPAIH